MTVEAATQAWLAEIPAGDQLAAAAATHAALWRWAITAAIAVLLPALILKSGVLLRLQAGLEAERPRPLVCAGASGGLIAAVLVAATAPLARMGGAPPGQLVSSGALAILEAIVICPIFIAVAGAWPKTWWAWCAPAAGAIVFAWAWGPSVLDGRQAGPPAPEGPVKAALQQLATRAGLPAEIVLSPGAGFDADVAAVSGHVRISVTREALAAPPAEVSAYVGHLMAHSRYGDLLTLALAMAGLAAAGTLALAGGYAPLARLLGAEALGRPSDPAGLPLAAMIIAAVIAVGTPILAAVGRAANVRADQYALDRSGEPAGLAAVLIRTWDHKALEPRPAEEALFYSHPPLASRIRHAMAWKQGPRR